MKHTGIVATEIQIMWEAEYGIDWLKEWCKGVCDI